MITVDHPPMIGTAISCHIQSVWVYPRVLNPGQRLDAKTVAAIRRAFRHRERITVCKES